jgi:hypothetical protein
LWAGSPSARAHLSATEADARTLGALQVANQAHALQK